MKSPIQSVRISVKTANTLEQFLATHNVSLADGVSLVVRPSTKHKGVIRGSAEDLHLFATLIMTSAEATDTLGRSALKKETQERLRAAARELLCSVESSAAESAFEQSASAESYAAEPAPAESAPAVEQSAPAPERLPALRSEALRALLPRVVFSNISPVIALLDADIVAESCISEEEDLKAHAEDCHSWQDCDCDYREPLSFYIVEQSFSDMLREQGELIYDLNGVLVWGRETFGQLLEDDAVVRKALYKLFPQDLANAKAPQVAPPAGHHISLEDLPSLLNSGVWGAELACSAFTGVQGDALLVAHMGSYAASLSADVDLWCARIRHLLALTSSNAPQWRAVLLPLLAVELSPQDQHKAQSAIINRVLSGVANLNESYPVNEWGAPYAFDVYRSLSQMVRDLLQHIARTC